MATQTQEAAVGASARRPIVIALNGVTGRMGYRQHLVRSLLAIREQGGLALADGTRLWPEPILVGRREHALREIAERHGLERWTTDLDEALAEPDCEIYFDSQVTTGRAAALRRAIAAGKHIYTEKPVAESVEEALELARLARAAGISHGVVQDKLFLPGLRKLRRLVDSGFFGGSCPCAASSATGCSRATGRRRTGRPGTTAPRTAAGSCSTCSATGATCSTR